MEENKVCGCSGYGCSEKTTERSEEERRKLVARLNRIEGQIRGLKNMVENDAYCNDILTQAAAATSALNGFSKEVLARHIHTCVAEDIRQGNDGAIDELMGTLLKLMK